MSPNFPIPTPTLGNAQLRIARPTRSISAILPFYVMGLGFSVLGSFKDHAGFDGFMLGHSSAPYHLEFTMEQGHDPGRAPTKDNLLVFYLPDRLQWKNAVAQMQDAGFEAVTSWNPYWDAEDKGRTFEDADGWRVVLWNEGWTD
jgi:hypothetical protein